jgi:hypothetical protein
VTRVTVEPDGKGNGGHCLTHYSSDFARQIPERVRVFEQVGFILSGLAAESVLLDEPSIWDAPEAHEACRIMARVLSWLDDSHITALRDDVWRRLRAGFAQPSVWAIVTAVADRLRRHRTLTGDQLETVIAAAGGYMRLRLAFSRPLLEHHVKQLTQAPPRVRRIFPGRKLAIMSGGTHVR